MGSDSSEDNHPNTMFTFQFGICVHLFGASFLKSLKRASIAGLFDRSRPLWMNTFAREDLYPRIADNDSPFDSLRWTKKSASSWIEADSGEFFPLRTHYRSRPLSTSRLQWKSP